MAKRLKTVVSLVLVVTLACFTCIGLAGCGRSSDSQEGSQGSGEQEQVADNPLREYTDMTGVTVEIPTKLTKVVSLWQVTTILTAFVGDTSSFQAVLEAVQDGKSMGWLAEMCPELADMPTVSSSPTVEELVALDPELVIVNEPMADQAEAYRAAGLTVVVMSNATNFDNLRTLVPKFAELYGSEAESKAADLMGYLDEAIAQAQSRTADIDSADYLKVYSNWAQRGTSPLLTSGDGSLISTWLNYDGCQNIITDQLVKGDSGNETNIETIIEADPDYILVGGVNWESALDTMKTDPSWSSLSAIKNDNILVNPVGVTKWSAIGVEFPLQILWFGSQVYPERFADIDIRSEVRDFYKKYLDYDISDANLDALLAGSLGPVE